MFASDISKELADALSPIREGGLSIMIETHTDANLNLIRAGVLGITRMATVGHHAPWTWGSGLLCSCPPGTFVEFDAMWNPSRRIVTQIFGGPGGRVQRYRATVCNDMTVFDLPFPRRSGQSLTLHHLIRNTWNCSYVDAVSEWERSIAAWPRHVQSDDFLYPSMDILWDGPRSRSLGFRAAMWTFTTGEGEDDAIPESPPTA